MEQLLELARERKLDRVGATYAVVAWIVVQAASIALPAFDAPPWALRWLIVVAMIGFPLVLALTWVKASRVPTATAARPFEGKDWLLTGLIALVAVLLIVQLALDYSWRRGTPPPSAPSTATVAASSIAVLPFANLSGDPKKVYFSDGIADQLITELAQTPSLRVAARSSSFAFRGKEVDVKTIAKALNVRAVLEGSVREDGNRVRIVAELINANDGFQIWSDSYDRDLTNILVLDCCRANRSDDTFKGGELSRGNEEEDRAPGISSVRLPTSGQFFVAYPSDPGTVAFEHRQERNGYFTGLLLPLLRVPGLRLTEIFLSVNHQLLIKSNNRQRSWQNMSLRTDITLLTL